MTTKKLFVIIFSSISLLAAIYYLGYFLVSKNLVPEVVKSAGSLIKFDNNVEITKDFTISAPSGTNQRAKIRLNNPSPSATEVLGEISFMNNFNDLTGVFGAADGSLDSGKIVFFTRNAGTKSEKMRLTKEGNVGIGTAGPEAKLHIKDSTPSEPTKTVLKLKYVGNGIGGPAIGFYNTWGDFYPNWMPAKIAGELTPELGGSLLFYTNSIRGYDENVNERMRIDYNGNLGIGTTNPGSYKLYVAGTAYSTGGWQSSDIRFKTDIISLNAALDKINQLNGVSFKWNTEEYKDKGFPEGRHYGLIAQEVEKVLPEVVKEGPDGEKSASYTELVPVLIEAVKELRQENEILKEKIKILELKINLGQ